MCVKTSEYLHGKVYVCVYMYLCVYKDCSKSSWTMKLERLEICVCLFLSAFSSFTCPVAKKPAWPVYNLDPVQHMTWESALHCAGTRVASGI